MPCSSTDDGAWGGCFASSSLATDPGACTAVGSRHTNNRRRPQQGEPWQAGRPEAAACRISCSSSSDLTIDNGCNDSAAVEESAINGPHGRSVVGASCPSGTSVVPVAQIPPFIPMQLAASAAARAAAQDKNSDGNGSDGDSDIDFFTPLSSPLRELPTPSMPAAAFTQGSAAAQQQQQQLRQRQQQQQLPEQQLTQQRASLEIPGIVSSMQQQNASTSSLPPAKECGLLLGRFPLRRRYMSADCGSSLLRQELQQEKQLHPSPQGETVASGAGLHFLVKTTVNAASGRDRVPLVHRISRALVQTRRCQGRPLQYQQQKHQFQWVQHPRQPLLQQQGQQQHDQQQHRLQREASDEDIRMPLVPPPASSSPLLSSSRVAPPTVTFVSLQTEECAPKAAAAEFTACADSREAAGVAVPGPPFSSNSTVLAEGEKQQAPAPLSLLSAVRLQQEQPEGKQQQQQPSREQQQEQQQHPSREQQQQQQQQPSREQQQQQQQQLKENNEEVLQCSKRRRFSVERSDSTCVFPSGLVAAAIPVNACIHTTSSSDEGEVQRQQSQQHMEGAARVEDLDFSSHRKRKRGGECSARLLLMLQPNAAAADAALLDVLGTALTAEETRELRMQQQKEAEAAAAAAAAAEAAARERTAAAAAAEAAAARAKAALEAEEQQQRQPQQQQRQPQQPQQPQQRQEQHLQPQSQQAQLQREQANGQKLQSTVGNTSGLGDLGAVQGRPKLRIRRANGAPGAAPSSTASTAAGAGISASPQQTVGFQHQQQQQPPFAPHNSALGQQVPLQQQMDVQGSVFQLSQVQPHQQYAQQPQLPQQVQQQQLAADGLGLGLAEFGPTKVPSGTDAGSNPFAFVAGRGRGRGGRRGNMRRR
ncbi:hypothetical protein, conserved [Eimeria praecox]|uniref:Uncharacterized protein n=1 Tax=Eimeria praecox TaxID=51316 RepID=U6G4E7_9EIME|nr:hypothetical protein, conserved [Eimeria praecox]